MITTDAAIFFSIKFNVLKQSSVLYLHIFVPAYVNTFDMTTNTDTQTQLFHILVFISVRTEEEFKFELNRPHITGS